MQIYAKHYYFLQNEKFWIDIDHTRIKNESDRLDTDIIFHILLVHFRMILCCKTFEL